MLGGDEAEEMQGVGVVGVFAEDGSVDFRSGGEVAAMVMGQSLFDQAGVAGFGGCFIVGGGHVFLITERCGAGQSRNGVEWGRGRLTAGRVAANRCAKHVRAPSVHYPN